MRFQGDLRRPEMKEILIPEDRHLTVKRRLHKNLPPQRMHAFRLPLVRAA